MRLEAVLSSKIEGTRTSVGQLLLFEADAHAADPPEGNLFEVVNYTVRWTTPCPHSTASP